MVVLVELEEVRRRWIAADDGVRNELFTSRDEILHQGKKSVLVDEGQRKRRKQKQGVSGMQEKSEGSHDKSERKIQARKGRGGSKGRARNKGARGAESKQGACRKRAREV